MIADVVEELLSTAPFVPFTIHAADGRATPIRHPDFAVLSQGGRTLVVNTEGERWAWIDLAQATLAERDLAPNSTGAQ